MQTQTQTQTHFDQYGRAIRGWKGIAAGGHQFTTRPAYGQVVYVGAGPGAAPRDAIGGELERMLARNLIKFAAGRAIACKCGKVLDCHTTVHVERKDTEVNGVFCVGCADSLLARWTASPTRVLVTPEGLRTGGSAVLEVIDGRRLWAASATRAKSPESPTSPKLPVSRNPVHKKDVEVGATYLMMVSGRLCRVRIDREETRVPWGSRTGARKTEWHGTNLRTGRPVTVRSAAKLRGRVEA